MNLRFLLTLYQRYQQRISRLEEVMSRRTSMLIFLLIRFVLMSAMVVGFCWYSLQIQP